jgi:hypothetical protein
MDDMMCGANVPTFWAGWMHMHILRDQSAPLIGAFFK